MIDVYWTPVHTGVLSSMRFLEPSPAGTVLSREHSLEPNHDFRRCPAYNDYFKNTFGLHIPVDYEININDEQVWTDVGDQEMFDGLVTVRSLENRLISLQFSYMFVAEEPLEIESFGAHTVQNDFTNNTIMVPGKYDIGKWIRQLDTAFFVKDGVDKLKIPADQVYSFVRFNTDKKINFKRFHYSQELKDLIDEELAGRWGKGKSFVSMPWYYEMLRKSQYRKYMMKFIKNNVL